MAFAAGCGVQQAPRSAAGAAPSSLGAEVYAANCLGCHGDTGDGRGRVAAYLVPRPRDLLHDSFRLRSTRPGHPPSRSDLRALLARGIPGSAMPSVGFLPPEKREALIAYLASLSPRLAATDELPAAAPAPGSSPRPFTPAAIATGRAVYERLKCARCHGDDGRGDGPVADELVDERKRPLHCRDLVADPFKGGEGIDDIEARLAAGMEGTPMTAVGPQQASDDERWQLAAYVASLRKKTPAGDSQAADRFTVTVRRISGRVPAADPLAAEWSAAKPTFVPVFPLAPREGTAATPAPLVVRVLHDGRTLAFRLEWADKTQDDGRPAGTEMFADGVAIQFIGDQQDRFIGMGSADSPVRIWHWKADWHLDGGALAVRPPIAPGADASLVLPTRPPAPKTARLPYVIEKQSSPVEEGWAAGAGTFSTSATQRTNGQGVWRAGTWTVVLSRTRAEAEAEVPLRGKVAFALWDGANRDRGSQKAISTWYELQIQPEE